MIDAHRQPKSPTPFGLMLKPNTDLSGFGYGIQARWNQYLYAYSQSIDPSPADRRHAAYCRVALDRNRDQEVWAAVTGGRAKIIAWPGE